jgi:tetratricopeptide (TPR) repeat protein
MSFRHGLFTRRLLPGAILAFACAGLAILMIRHSSTGPRPTAPATRPAERRETPLPAGADPSLTNAAPTSVAGPGAGEDRVVALVAEANQLLERGQYAEAAGQYEQAARLDPEGEDLQYNLAIALAKLGKTEEAKRHYAEALRIFPDHGEAHNNLGNVLMKENQLAEAIDHFREAIRIMPDNAAFHNNLGTAFGRQGQVAEARAEFAQAVKLSPTYVEARVNLGNACLASGEIQEAVAQLDEALRLKPDFAPAIQAMQRARERQVSGPPPK